MNTYGTNPVLGSSWRDDTAAQVINDLRGNNDDLTATIFKARDDFSNVLDAEDFMEVFNAFHTRNYDKKVVVVGEPQFPVVTGGEPQFPVVTGRESQFPAVVEGELQFPAVMGGEPQFSGSSQNVTIQEQTVKTENICPDNLENRTQGYDMTDDEYEFHVEESDKKKNKPYEFEENCIVAKRNQAIKIRVGGARSGQVVKMHMLFKDETHYQKPVQACRKHNIDSNPNTDSTFYVVNKIPILYDMVNPVKYETEDGHPTAVMTVPAVLKEAFFVCPIFRCWNSCNSVFGREQHMILRLCDTRTGEVLHMASFDVRICENVGRDWQVYIKQEKKDLKRLKRSMSKKLPRHRMRNAAKACEELQDTVMDQTVLMPSPTPKSRCYMVEVDDDLFPVLDALVKVRGKKMIEVDPASLSEAKV